MCQALCWAEELQKWVRYSSWERANSPVCEAEKYQMRTAQHEKCLDGGRLGYLPEHLGKEDPWNWWEDDPWTVLKIVGEGLFQVEGENEQWAKGKGTETGESLGDLVTN